MTSVYDIWPTLWKLIISSLQLARYHFYISVKSYPAKKSVIHILAERTLSLMLFAFFHYSEKVLFTVVQGAQISLPGWVVGN